MRAEAEGGVQVIRYVNDYENPGAISLVTTVDSLSIVDSVKFTGKDDLMDRIAELTARFM